MNPIYNAFAQSDLFGKSIFLLLFLLSILTWSLFIKKLNTIRAHQKKGGSALKKYAHDLLSKRSHQTPLTPSEFNLLEAHVHTRLSKEQKGLEKNLHLLSTTVSLAPFLGLLGTVWGILLTFSELQSGMSANANSLVMGGLAMALGTTVIGLVVAIPALIAYNSLRARLRQFAAQMEDEAQLLLANIAQSYRSA